MASKKIHKALEEAILALPAKEKNKLLLRLISKNAVLVDQLEYKLLENPELDLPERVSVILNEFDAAAQYFGTQNARQALALYKYLVAKINYHKKVTADKLSELRLIAALLLFLIEKCGQFLGKDGSIFAHKLDTFFVKKALALTKLLKTVHEDYLIEFTDATNQILEFVHTKPYTQTTAKILALPKSIE
jgi:hypothetical protein